MIVFFVFYVDSRFFWGIFVTFYFGWKPHNSFGGVVARYAFCKGEFGAGCWKNKFSTLENSWKTSGIFLSVSVHHVVTIVCLQCCVELACLQSVFLCIQLYQSCRQGNVKGRDDIKSKNSC